MHWEGSKRALVSVLKEISRVTSGHSDQLIANMLKYMVLRAKELRGRFLKVSEQGNAGSGHWSLWALKLEKNRICQISGIGGKTAYFREMGFP